MALTLVLEEKTHVLEPSACHGFYNDEIKAVEEITVESILEMAKYLPMEAFEREYYKDDCGGCEPIERGRKQLLPYWEGHFFLFTKEQKPVMSNICPEYKETSFNQLIKKGLVDDSYVVSLIVCPACSVYQIQIDQVDM